MALPARLDLVDDLRVYRGDDWSLRIRFTADGDPMPLTGVWRAQHRAQPLGRATEMDLADSDLAGGVIILRLAPDANERLMPGSWDLQQTTVGGRRVTWFEGRVEVAGEVTR